MPFCKLCGTCYPVCDKHECPAPPAKVGYIEYGKPALMDDRKRFHRGMNVVKGAAEDEDEPGEVPEVSPTDV